MTKRALVMSGGGARGAFQVGMLKELVGTKGLDFQIIRGVSVGSLNAAFLAQAATTGDSQQNLVAQVAALEDTWRNEVTGNDSIYKGRAGFIGLVAGADSLYSIEPLRELMEEKLDFDALAASGRDFEAGYVSLVTGEYGETTPSDDDFFEKLVASSSMPVIFPYVDLEDVGEVLVDGGARDITPLSSAFAAGAEEIYVLLASRVVPDVPGTIPDSAVEVYDYEAWDDNWLGTKVSGLDVLARTVGILTDEIYLDDIRGALAWNEIVAAIEQTTSTADGATGVPQDVADAVAELKATLQAAGKRYVPIHVIAPRQWFDEAAETGEKNSAIEFDPALIATAIDHGEAVARDPDLWLWP